MRAVHNFTEQVCSLRFSGSNSSPTGSQWESRGSFSTGASAQHGGDNDVEFEVPPRLCFCVAARLHLITGLYLKGYFGNKATPWHHWQGKGGEKFIEWRTNSSCSKFCCLLVTGPFRLRVLKLGLCHEYGYNRSFWGSCGLGGWTGEF